MKRLVSTIIIAMSIVVLTACGASTKSNDKAKNETTTFIMKVPGINSKIEVIHNGDNVIKTITSNEMFYAPMGLDGSDIETVKPMIENATKMYDDMSGVSNTVTYKEDKVIEVVETDISKASEESLQTLYVNAAKGKTVSYKILSKNLESNGFTKQ